MSRILISSLSLTLTMSLLPSIAMAQSPMASPAKQVQAVPGSSLKAYGLARERKWAEARIEAVNATQSSPSDPKSWFMLAVVEERIENLSESEAAYRKYLSMNPTPQMAGTVETKLQEVSARANNKEKAIWGLKSNGFFLGFSPTAPTDGIAPLKSSLKSSFDAGFHFGNHSIGLRRGTGSITSFRAPVKGVSNTNTYTTVGPASLTYNEMYYSGNVVLIEPYDKWNGLSLALPLVIGGYGYVINAPGGRNFDNLGYDLGAGLSLKWFSRSSFNIEVSSIYHLGIPLWEPRESSDSKAIRPLVGTDDITGQLSGLEFRVAIGFLFGAETTGHF